MPVKTISQTLAEQLYGVGGVLSVMYGIVQLVHINTESKASIPTKTLGNTFAAGSLAYGVWCCYRAYFTEQSSPI